MKLNVTEWVARYMYVVCCSHSVLLLTEINVQTQNILLLSFLMLHNSALLIYTYFEEHMHDVHMYIYVSMPF